MLKLLQIFAIVGMIICTTSCQTSRAVILHDDDVVRLGPDVKGRIYYWSGTNWVLTTKKVTLPEGWYAGGMR